MPVYKGGRKEGTLLTRCLESLMSQTFRDFKVIIANNDSPDNTEGIIYNTVRHDKRFEYHRNTINYGYFPNALGLVANCDTKYYAMLHFDSYYAPTYAEKCVKALENDSQAVLAYSYCQFVDEDNKFFDIYKDLISFDQADPAERYLNILKKMGWCTAYHGVIRQDVLVKHLFRTASTDNAAFDNELLALLALEGKFLQINAPLFYRLKDTYQDKGETAEAHHRRLFAKGTYRPHPVKLPYCNFISDHCFDILYSSLPAEKKDYLIQNTILALLQRYDTLINGELSRLIDAIVSGNFRYDELDPEEVSSGNFKLLDYYILSKLLKELSFAFVLKPTFPKLNLALAFIYMYLGRHKEALFYVEQELLLTPQDALCLTLKEKLSQKV
jgi:glycosyltransferase involved in cell wall biosynthesis